MHIRGDSLVLVDEQPALLCYADLVPGSVRVRNRYEETMEGCESYIEGRDYVVDYEQGALRRTADSRIPNFRYNILFGIKGFDHTKYETYGNHDYFVWVDYDSLDTRPLAESNSQAYLLPQTVQRLTSGGPFKVVAFGDSITAGGEASEVRLRYQERWITELAKLYPRAELLSLNSATGGDDTFLGLQRLQDKVISHNPDLVLIAFGMNDLRISGSVFSQNLKKMIERIRQGTAAEVMVISTFPPNPDWIYATGNSYEIAAATEATAREMRCAYADVHSVWARVLQRKNLPSLLGNNINHPNNFGHWLYLQALLAAFPG